MSQNKIIGFDSILLWGFDIQIFSTVLLLAILTFIIVILYKKAKK